MRFITSVILLWTIFREKDIANGFEEEPSILLAGNGGIYLYNTSTHALRHVVNVSHPINSIDYHLSKNQGFAIWNDVIHRFPLLDEQMLPSDVHPTFVTEVSFRCPTFAIDWVHDMIFWPDCRYHHIISMGIEDSHYSQETLIKLPQGAWAMDMVVDPYKGLLFWTTGAMLMSCRLDGRELKKVVPEFPVNRVSSLSLDLATERVYFSGLDKHDKNSSNLYFTNYNGSTSHSLQFHEYEGGMKILSFGIFNAHLYFIKEGGPNSSTVMETKLEFLHRPKMFLIEKDLQMNHLKMVHPQLQFPAKTDACTERNCSHLCLLEESVPHCLCPRMYVLEDDNTTCTFYPDEREEEPLFLKVASGVMLVLIVLLGAGVLMGLCDKLWTNLHPTAVRLRVTRTLAGAWAQDGVNLI